MLRYTLFFSLLTCSYLSAKSEIVAPPSTSLSSFSQQCKQNVEPIPDLDFAIIEEQDVMLEQEEPFESPSNPSSP